MKSAAIRPCPRVLNLSGPRLVIVGLGGPSETPSQWVLDKHGAPFYKPRSALMLIETGGAQVAQLVEQRTENPRVGGSIPPLGTKSLSGTIQRHPKTAEII